MVNILLLIIVITVNVWLLPAIHNLCITTEEHNPAIVLRVLSLFLILLVEAYMRTGTPIIQYEWVSASLAKEDLRLVL